MLVAEGGQRASGSGGHTVKDGSRTINKENAFERRQRLQRRGMEGVEIRVGDGGK